MTETRTTESFPVHPALVTPGSLATGEVIHVDFGLTDSRGRAIGGVIRIFPHIAFQGSDAGWAAMWTVTRNGADFGGGNRLIFGSSSGEVERVARRKLDGSRDRYRKQASRGAL